jgi:hypothetical protein
MSIVRSLLDYLADPTAELPAPQVTEAVLEAILQVLERPERNGGVTYSLLFGDQWGQPFYAVGLDNDLSLRLDVPDDLREELRAFMERHRELLAHPRCCLGIWKGMSEDGVVRAFIDVAVLVYNESIARRFGEEGDQIAIFDLRRGVEIDTGGTGLPLPDGVPRYERLRRLEAQDRIGDTEERQDEQ